MNFPHLHPAERMVLLRQALGLSQRELAKEFQVSPGAIALWESGTREISGPVLRLIELYEKALPGGGKTAPRNHDSQNLLEEFRSHLCVEACDEVNEALSLIKNGMNNYFDDMESMNSLNGKLKQIMIQRLLKSLKSSKGVSIKIAQLASFLEMGLPLEVRYAMGTLQGRLQPSKPKAIRDIVEAEYGRPLKEVFPEWRSEPIAVTSLAQVHWAKLPNGQEVAVKVQHPEIREILQKQFRNMDLIKSLAAIVGKDDSGMFEEIQRMLMQECDYHTEALNQEKFRNLLSDHPDVVIPYVHRDLVRSRVLVTEFVRGESFQSFVIRATTEQRAAAAETILEALTKAAFGYCLNHTDMHFGNFLFADGKVIILDFGRVVEGSRERMKQEAQCYMALLHKDYDKAKSLAPLLFAKDPNDFDFDAFWSFMQKSNRHLMVDEKFKFNRTYVESLSREGRLYSKKHQLKIDKNSFCAFVFSVSIWGVLAELDAPVNHRRVALRIIPLSGLL